MQAQAKMLAQDRRRVGESATTQPGEGAPSASKHVDKGKGRARREEQESIESSQYSPPKNRPNLGFAVPGDEGYIETAGQNDFEPVYVSPVSPLQACDQSANSCSYSQAIRVTVCARGIFVTSLTIQ